MKTAHVYGAGAEKRHVFDFWKEMFMENQIVHFSRRTVSVVLLVAFIGALIGSGTMYLAIRDRLPAAQSASPVQSQNVVHIQAEGVRTVDIKTAVTDAVGKVGPAVVTVSII